MEIERKFLIKKQLNNLDSLTKLEIEQYYISINPVIRLRKSNSQYYLTIKGPGQISREEFELPITKEQYEKLSFKIEGNKLLKTRYLIPIQENLMAEMDVYYGDLKGLFTVEVEFNSLANSHNFEPPHWFGEEISHCKEYKNSSLAVFGLPNMNF